MKYMFLLVCCLFSLQSLSAQDNPPQASTPSENLPGTSALPKEIIGMNFLLGIGGVITYKNAGLGEVVGKIDLQHLALETDAPYLTPVPHRGKRNESAYLELIVNKIAEVKNISVEEVGATTTANAEKLFRK